MSPKREIKELALLQGAQLVGVTRVEVYANYLAEVERRTQDTGAQLADFMISPVTDHEGRVISEDTSFFARLSDARQSLPSAKTIILLGVYAYDETAVYKNARRELRGKTARIYNYYPVVRHIAERVAAFIEGRELDRQLHLHSRELVLAHPRTGKDFRFVAPAPPHMLRAFDLYGFNPADGLVDPFPRDL